MLQNANSTGNIKTSEFETIKNNLKSANDFAMIIEERIAALNARLFGQSAVNPKTDSCKTPSCGHLSDTHNLLSDIQSTLDRISDSLSITSGIA